MDNKKIANYALDFIGGNPEVFTYYNDDETKKIDIMFCKDDANFSVVSTIGLSSVDIGMTFENKPLRVELIILGSATEEIFGNILASAAFWVGENHYCNFGIVIDNVIDAETDLKHVILMQPSIWKDYKPYELENNIVAWLMAIPINDAEKNYIEQNGVDAFDKILEESQIDLTDLHRKSCV